jgi:hypothetical protein
MGAIATPCVPLDQLSHVIAEVTFLHAIPPRCICFVVTNGGNIQAEIIYLCHAIVEPNVIIVTLNNLAVEIVVSHGVLINKCNVTDIRGNRNPYCASSETVIPLVSFPLEFGNFLFSLPTNILHFVSVVFKVFIELLKLIVAVRTVVLVTHCLG